jgi:hypothetical protein
MDTDVFTTIERTLEKERNMQVVFGTLTVAKINHASPGNEPAVTITEIYLSRVYQWTEANRQAVAKELFATLANLYGIGFADSCPLEELLNEEKFCTYSNEFTNIQYRLDIHVSFPLEDA